MTSAYRSYEGIDDSIEEALGADPLPLDATKANSNTKSGAEMLLNTVRGNIVGATTIFEGPFGAVPCVYADWTASGRALRDVEEYITDHVLPYYGNTHTSTSITGHQTTCFRHESRQIVAQSVNAKITGKAAEDVVIFTGNGTTAAIARLVLSLDLHLPLPPEHTEDDQPVVFTSAYEHHSNLLPWRESVAEVITVRYNDITGVDLVHLRELLLQYRNRKLKIGTFSAASNVTGILTAVNDLCILLHEFGALAFFDYATAAPYVRIDVNPVLADTHLGHLAYKDAVVFSGHKFLGGPGCPGVLIVKKRILPQNDSKPTVPGGGTVFYVTEDHHRYLSNKEEREEGGTPYVIGDIKLGIVLHLKHKLGSAWIETEELRISDMATIRLNAIPNLVLLGRSTESGRHLPIFSFLIRRGNRFLHHNFVCALLNDLFGVQTRGGCQCAGPFSQAILGLSAAHSRLLELSLLDKHEVLRPGYSRFSLPYWMSISEIDHVLNAVEFVAVHGHKFLSLYRYNPKTGEWAHTSRMTKFPGRIWLSNFEIGLESKKAHTFAVLEADNLKKLFSVATSIVEQIDKAAQGKRIVTKYASDLTTYEGLRWFALSGDSTDQADAPDVPIRPQLWNPLDNETSPQINLEKSSGSESVTAYAKQRSEDKLIARTSSMTVYQPRYLSFQASETGLVQFGYAESSDGNKPPVTPYIKSDISVVASDVVKAPNLVETIETDGPVCMIQRRNLPPVDVESLTEDKVMSGPGTTYCASPDSINTKMLKQPPKKIMKLVGQAVKDWSMIEDGDSLLLGLSGGKDSLALLHVLLALQKRAPVRFSLACATVDPQTESFDPSPLIPYIQSLGVTYHYLSEPIVALAKTKMQGDSLCAFCSRFKRGLLYSCCRRNGYNKLILAQHLDDLAESFFMSALHNGQIRTMKAHYKIDAGDIRVIRPFAYVRETATRDFSVQSNLPIINENCPACFEQPKERNRIKKLLAQEEAMVPALFYNLRRAFLPLMHEDTYVAMEKVSQMVEAISKEPKPLSTRGKRPAESGLICTTPDNELDHSPMCKKIDRKQITTDSKPGSNEILNGEKNKAGAECSSSSGRSGYCPPCYEIC